MLRLCHYHGLERWFIVHTFYNGVLFSMGMTVDAAVNGALMNKILTKLILSQRIWHIIIINGGAIVDPLSEHLQNKGQI